MEQGRSGPRVHMFGIPFEHMPELFPYGIYTIPEVSMVGQTEENTYSAEDSVRGGSCKVLRACKEHDARR